LLAPAASNSRATSGVMEKSRALTHELLDPRRWRAY